MIKDNHIVFEIIHERIEYVCKLGVLFKKSQYKYAFDRQNSPLKMTQENYYTFLLDMKRDYHTWEKFNRTYDRRLSIKKGKSK